MQVEYKGKSIQIDEQDLPLLNSREWYYKPLRNGRFCLAAREYAGNKATLILLHVLILNRPPGKHVEWLDGDSLNMQRDNMSICSRAESLIQAAKARKGKTAYPCPFGRGKLEELMWAHGLTLEQIGERAAELENWNKSPGPEIVKRWLKSAGVRTRTLSEAMKSRAASDLQNERGIFAPEVIAQASERALNRHKPIITQTEHGVNVVVPARRGWKHTEASKRKISQNRKGIPRERYSTFTLTCPICNRQFQRFISEMADHTNYYCSRECSNAAKRKPETRPCVICGTLITKTASYFKKSTKPCCSRKCGSTLAQRTRKANQSQSESRSS